MGTHPAWVQSPVLEKPTGDKACRGNCEALQGWRATAWVPRAQVGPAMVTGTRTFAGCCPDSRPSDSGVGGKVKEALPEVESGEVSWKRAGFRGEEPGVSVHGHARVCAGFRDSRH